MKGIVLWVFCLFGMSLSAQVYDISVEIENYEYSSIMIGYHFGNQQFVQDTIEVNTDGIFSIQGDEALIPGIYMLILQPGNSMTEILIEDGRPKMQIRFDANEPTASFQVKGSPENEEFYDYLRYLDGFTGKIVDLRNEAEKDSTNVDAMAEAEEKIVAFKEEIAIGQKKWTEENPGGFVTALIKANSPLDIPDFEGTSEEKNVKKWNYYRDHYFDHISLSDRRLLRTPILLTRLDYYLDRLTVQHPDSIISTMEVLVPQMLADSVIFKFGISHLLNKYVKSNIVGMDAIYVHLIEKYYANGMTPWVAKDNIAKMTREAAKIKPLLIGKIAPNFQVYKKDLTPISLHAVNSPYTVLFFWAPDCSHCKKSMPSMVEFYNNYKDKGVEIMAVCTKSRDKEPACWDIVQEKGMDIWVNASDKTLKSRFQVTYDIKSTPQIYILDEHKRILFKRIGSDQLPLVMDQILTKQLTSK